MKSRSFIPNSTQVPNILLRHFMHLLKDTEFKCLMMICDQTFGWGREVDAIALSQFEKGITSYDGTLISGGTGASKTSIIDAIKRLSESGLVQVHKGNTNKYEINIDCDIEYAKEYFGGNAPPITYTTLPKKEKATKKSYGQFKNVFLSDEEKQKLISQFGKDKAKEWVETLSIYLESSKKRYASHYATILSWDRRENKSPKTYSPNEYQRDIQKRRQSEEEQKEKEQVISRNKKALELNRQMGEMIKGKRV